MHHKLQKATNGICGHCRKNWNLRLTLIKQIFLDKSKVKYMTPYAAGAGGLDMGQHKFCKVESETTLLNLMREFHTAVASTSQVLEDLPLLNYKMEVEKKWHKMYRDQPVTTEKQNTA